jgi:hypothetical protein
VAEEEEAREDRRALLLSSRHFLLFFSLRLFLSSLSRTSGQGNFLVFCLGNETLNIFFFMRFLFFFFFRFHTFRSTLSNIYEERRSLHIHRERKREEERLDARFLIFSTSGSEGGK